MPHIEMSRTQVKVHWRDDPQRNAKSRRRIIERDGIPELVSAVDSGRIPLSRAREIARLPRDKQAAAIASSPPRRKAGRPKRSAGPDTHYANGFEAGVRVTADVKALSGATAQERLQAAIKRKLKELELVWERRLSDAVHAQIRKIMPDLQKEKEAAFFDQQFYQKLALEKAIFTDEQVMAIIRCLHPDSQPSIELRTRAFQLIQGARPALTGKRK